MSSVIPHACLVAHFFKSSELIELCNQGDRLKQVVPGQPTHIDCLDSERPAHFIMFADSSSLWLYLDGATTISYYKTIIPPVASEDWRVDDN